MVGNSQKSGSEGIKAKTGFIKSNGRIGKWFHMDFAFCHGVTSKEPNRQIFECCGWTPCL